MGVERESTMRLETPEWFCTVGDGGYCGVDGGGRDEGFKGTFTRGGRSYVGGGKAVRACVGGFPHGGGGCCVWK